MAAFDENVVPSCQNGGCFNNRFFFAKEAFINSNYVHDFNGHSVHVRAYVCMYVCHVYSSLIQCL